MSQEHPRELHPFERLLATCVDGFRGYDAAAARAHDPAIRALLAHAADERWAFARELETLAEERGWRGYVAGTLAGRLHRGWLEARHAVHPTTDVDLLEECVRGEEDALVRCEALDRAAGPELAPIVEHQVAAIRASVATLRACIASQIEDARCDAARARAIAIAHMGRTMVVATWSPEGPHATPVLYTTDGFVFDFVAPPSSRLAFDVAREPRVALSIHGNARSWRDVDGLQIDGRAEAIDDPTARARALRRLADRFPVFAERARRGGATHDVVIRVHPLRVVLTDHEHGRPTQPIALA